MSQTLDQRRAAHALARVNAARNDPKWTDKQRDSYADYVERLPAMILINGLGQAAAAELAAGKKQPEHLQLYKDLESWLCGPDGACRGPDLIRAIVEGDRDTYLRAQVEALAWLEWLKKFAVAYLKQPEEARK